MKNRKAMEPVFKPYSMGQMLLPQNYEEMIPEDHLVRVVNRAVEQIDVESLVGQAGSRKSHFRAGKQLRAQRSVDVETPIGDIKHNMGFRRFHLRGQQKVNTEWLLVCIAHNMRKLAV